MGGKKVVQGWYKVSDDDWEGGEYVGEAFSMLLCVLIKTKISENLKL